MAGPFDKHPLRLFQSQTPTAANTIAPVGKHWKMLTELLNE
jgi:hypothetical protein